MSPSGNGGAYFSRALVRGGRVEYSGRRNGMSVYASYDREYRGKRRRRLLQSPKCWFFKLPEKGRHPTGNPVNPIPDLPRTLDFSRPSKERGDVSGSTVQWCRALTSLQQSLARFL